MPAVGITDRANLFDAVQASQYAAKAGVQPLVGCLLPVRSDDPASANGRPPAPALLPVLVQDEAGYHNLLQLLSRAYLGGEGHGPPELPLDDLARSSGGLIALTGGPEGPPGRALLQGNRGLAESLLERLTAIFPGRLYVELMRHGQADEDQIEPALIEAARALRSAAGRDQRRPFPRGGGVRGARRPALHRRRRPGRAGAAPPADPGAPLQDRGRDGPAVRRSARGGRQHARDRAALQLHGADPRADPAAVPDRGGAQRGRGAAPPGGSRARARGSRRWAVRRMRPMARGPSSHGPYRERLRLRARGDRGHELFRLLPDRRRLHPVGQGAGHPGRPGTRLRRGLGGRLVARDHRPRSLALRPPVRALPQSRAGLDAGLRRRLLPGPARRGDPLRARQIRRRPGRGDHHLRQAAGARGAARRRPRARHALRPGRPGREAGAVQSGPSADPRAGARARAASRRGRARGRAGRAPARHREATRGPAAPRLDPRRRRGDRRPPARRAGAALSRPALRHAGDPVQHEGRRAGRPGQVRLFGPHHAHAAGAGRAPGQPARHPARACGAAARRPCDLRAARARRDRRRVPAGIRAACARRCASSSRTASTTSPR